ncbi:MAG: MBL fold metallo-hydrolase, partial [Opitutaceae bacterium]|nr:MBL fold metallo-hydrolase [Opitutaceae bacterium]
MNKLPLLALLATLAVATALPAQTAAAPSGEKSSFRPNYHKDPDALLQDQAAVLFNQSYAVLDAYRPTVNPGIERKLALFAIDTLLHDPRLDYTPAFLAQMDDVVRRVAATLASPGPLPPLRIIRFYNHGFILKTPTVTIAIDIIRGGKTHDPKTANARNFLTEEQLRPIVALCDVLLVSHEHGDHADPVVAKMFCDQGKPVVAPPGIWREISPLIVRPRAADATAPAETTLALGPKKHPLRVRAYPGHQGKILNNLYLITTPEGKTILHTGDQSGGPDMP